jgi:hypothetical protein
MAQISQAWQTAMVTDLMYSANGDLILDAHGNLCSRNVWGPDDKELPWAQHRIGNRLATLSRLGWMLTRYGADFILENCPPDKTSDIRKLEAIAAAI